MQCVILAAGEGTRMRPLTLYRPKPMLHVFGVPILEHILYGLPREVDEAIVVVGYLADHIRGYFGERFGRLKMRYVVQDRPFGTYHALLLAKPLLRPRERFLVMYADDLHGKSGIAACAAKSGPALLIAPVSDPRPFGVVTLDRIGNVVSIEEKPRMPATNLVSTGVMALDGTIFDCEPSPSQNGEYYLSNAMRIMVRERPVLGIRASAWQPIGYPEDLRSAHEFLISGKHLL